MHEAALLLERTSVRAELIDGETVFADGRLTRIEDGPVVYDALKSVRLMLRRIGLS